MEFHNFFGQEKLFRIFVLSANLNTKSTCSKIFTYAFLTRNLVEMKQNNKSVTSQWHFANNNDIVVAHVLISGFVQLKTASFKSTVEIYELML